MRKQTAVAMGVFLSGAAFVSAAPAASTAESPPSDGILPLQEYLGDLTSRRFLAGDWGGTRSELASMGLSFELNWTQVAQGVVDGGKRRDWDFGGNVDAVLNADLQRMGVLPGALLKLRAESRYGESVNDDTGAILPANTAGGFPLTDRINEGVPMTITELTFTQFLSPSIAVSLGKIQTLDGDPNEFASGRGRTQFLNGVFNYNPASAVTVPYSTLGVGVLWLPTDSLTITSAIMNRADSSTTTGFDNIENGWTWSIEGQYQYRLGGLPGGVNVGGAYSFAGDFSDLGARLQFAPSGAVTLPKEGESFFVYASCWQYLYSPDQISTKINPGDGRPDLRGIGIFSRFGYADADTNPLVWTASLGLGGRGIVPGRDDDNFGVGYSYTKLESGDLFTALNAQDSTQAVEMFYNVAITPSIGLTLNAQWLDGGSESVSAATVLGVRLNIRF